MVSTQYNLELAINPRSLMAIQPVRSQETDRYSDTRAKASCLLLIDFVSHDVSSHVPPLFPLRCVLPTSFLLPPTSHLHKTAVMHDVGRHDYSRQKVTLPRKYRGFVGVHVVHPNTISCLSEKTKPVVTTQNIAVDPVVTSFIFHNFAVSCIEMASRREMTPRSRNFVCVTREA